MSALHDFIAPQNDIEGLRDLLRAGENPNSHDRSGRTPLHIAVLQCEQNPQDTDYLALVVRQLIYFGAVVDQGNNMSKTPLHYAVGMRNCKMIETLLQCNAQVNHIDNEGQAAMHFATSKRRFRRHIVYDTDVEVVKLLLKYRPKLDIQKFLSRETALMYAVQNNNLYIVRELLKNNASGDLQDSHGSSAMHLALDRPEVNVDIVFELMSYGCSFNMTNDDGISPMTLYFWRLLRAPYTEMEKAKFVFKLYLLDGNDFTYIHHMYILELSQKHNLRLSRYIMLCKREIKRMQIDALPLSYCVYDIVLRGSFHAIAENLNHIPLEVFDKVLSKLLRRQYPVYCDLIAAGICSPYMNEKFAELCCRVAMDDCFLKFDEFYMISFYLSHFDMLNMMIACCGNWMSYWYLPRFTHNTRCSVS